MDLVYSNALLTIIAAAGLDADAGLPGVREGSRMIFQKRAKIYERNDRNLWIMQILMQNPHQSFQNSCWSTRGWTFQEQLLSRKTLIFTADQVFWNCQKRTWNEETILECEKPRIDSLDSMLSYSLWEHSDPKFLRKVYYEYVAAYNGRVSIYKSDVLPAFQGYFVGLRRKTG